MSKTKHQHLSQIFTQQAAETPNHIALKCQATCLTYSDLHRKATRLALVLQAAGVKSGVLVGICGGRSIDYIVAMVAVNLSGGAYLPIDPTQPQQRVDYILNDAKPSVVLVAENVTLQLLGAGSLVICLAEAAWKDLPANQELLLSLDTEDAVYVMYMSGSTGEPKGVCIPQRGVSRLVRAADYASFGTGIRILQNSPLSFDASTYEIWGSLLNGGTCVLNPFAKPSLQDLEDILVTEGVTTLFLTTALFVELAERLPRAFRTVKEVLTGGEVIPPTSVKRLLSLNPGLSVVACYGPTECTTFASTQRYSSAEEVGEIIPLGQPIAETELFVLRDELTAAQPGEEAELYIGGSGLALEYLNRPELTQAAFVRSPFSADPNSRLYRTGDRCVHTADGRFLFKGRVDRQIKLRGFRIELGEVDAALAQHPSVQSAYVKTAETVSGDKVLVAYAVPTQESIARDPLRDEANFAERTRQWQEVYSKLLYKSLATSDLAGNDPTFNTSGWKSTFDGRHIPSEQMEEQVGQTVERILSLAPRTILELGCGTGMLLFRLAEHVDSYVATDFSQDCLDYVEERLPGWPGGDRVTLLHRHAHKLPEPPPGLFDVVVINSVTEHFASLDYLDRLLASIAPIVRKGGYIFVGDNRNFTLLSHFHAAVQLAKSPGTRSRAGYAVLAEQATADEQQLTIDPYYFAQLDRSMFGTVALQLRRGVHHNELTGYRYDAILQLGAPATATAVSSPRTWQSGVDSLIGICRELRAEKPDQLVIRGLPNSRLRGSALLLDAVARRTSIQSTGELKRSIENSATGEDPEDFWRMGSEFGYDVQILPAQNAADGQFDVVFRKSSKALLDVSVVTGPVEPRPLSELANDPLLSWRKDQLAQGLRRHLEQCVPEYAVPAFFVLLSRFPLTANSKIDTAALPVPARLSVTESGGAKERLSVLGEQTRAVWESVLGISNISQDEKFFEIGGDSLKSVRVAADLSKLLRRDISPALIFEEPTIRGLEKRLSQAVSFKPVQASRGQTRRAAFTSQVAVPV